MVSGEAKVNEEAVPAVVAPTTVTLGDRMKQIEAESESITRIHPTEGFIIRLDGKNFSTFTRGFKKPFDPLFMEAMVRTTQDVVSKFNPTTGYTHSDEITLIFPPLLSQEEYDEIDDNKPVRQFNGRVSKLLTLTAGYVSVRFNFHIWNLLEPRIDEYKEGFVKKVYSHQQMFDARLMVFPDWKQVASHQVWRQRDCFRNSISQIARMYFSNKQLHGKKTPEQIKMIIAEGVASPEELESYQRYLSGVYIKKEKYEKTVTFTVKSVTRTETAVRTRETGKQMGFTHWTDEVVTLLTSKYWDPEQLASKKFEISIS